MGGLGRCKVCGERSPLISDGVGVCLNCIRGRSEEALRVAGEAHARSREAFGLPPEPPRSEGGVACGLCANNCRIGEGEVGFCGLVFNVDGRLVRRGGTPEAGILEWYYDPLPTNCVAWWFCPGCTGAGYPKYAYTRGAEGGYSNLAVFYGSCSYDCLYCQNWQHRRLASKLRPRVSAEALAYRARRRDVSCICYFGGDPSTQMPHALKVSKLALDWAWGEGRILRICWESNGNMNRRLALKAAELSLKSGGVVKFDLKAYDENLNKALCGVSNRATLENFKLIGEKFYDKRPEVPLLTASTLLVPGYVDADEVERIAEFIASVNPEIPYTLLAFYPQYVMRDLPTTSRKQAYECREAAKKHLNNVRIGNVHLLS